ncbi:hypothetical protein D9757_009729 [Collybiopsis confluens]|uniref:Cytochrome P450 n=1 Tax=Collybiopsis confluens TaxID=2823264 RepID=A0A8H5M1Q2_9AGAR|nr:hypothetical protein D9757_009729 [Collybiopsis confluens]
MVFQVILSLIALLYVGALIIYRVFLHPLRKYPGPILAALTEGYEAYYNIVKEGGLVAEIERLHDAYGPVVRVGPNTLHFKDKKAFHDIYTYGRTLIKEPQFYHGLMAHCEESSIGFTDPEEAAKRRNLLGPLFSRRAVVALEYTIQAKIDKLITLLIEVYSFPDSSLDISSAYLSLTLDIITSYCFGECTDALDSPGFSHPFIRGMEAAKTRLWLIRHFPFFLSFTLRMPQKLVLWISPTFKGYLDLVGGLERQVDSLLKNPESAYNVEHETIYHHLLASVASQDRPSRKSLLDEAFMLVGAGTGTSSNACTVGTFYFLKNRIIRQNILLELDEAWPDKDRPVNFVVLEKLPYLTAFIRETLRIAPGVIHPLPRMTSRNLATMIGDWEVPPGTIVEMSVLSMHLDSDIFPDPHTFKPERWLTVADEDINKMLENLSPFSKGPRICLGLNLAWCELYLIFANIFRKLDLTLLVTEDTIEDYSKDYVDAFVASWGKGYRVFVDRERQE